MIWNASSGGCKTGREVLEEQTTKANEIPLFSLLVVGSQNGGRAGRAKIWQNFSLKASSGF
jgi:hypothetical protein